jgi:ABC-type branched-subunit amino acid transport system permease subunit
VLLAPFLVYPIFAMMVRASPCFASAFNLLLGYVGLLSFGHAAFFGMATTFSAQRRQGVGDGRRMNAILFRHLWSYLR